MADSSTEWGSDPVWDPKTKTWNLNGESWGMEGLPGYDPETGKVHDPGVSADNGTPLVYDPAKRGYVTHEGTSYERNYDPRNPYASLGNDPRSYMYGRDPNAANVAVDRAWGTGTAAADAGTAAANAGLLAGSVGEGMAAQQRRQGNKLLEQRTADAQAYGGRGAPGGYAGQLAGLEAQQGPSAAQAQLQAGSNQALANTLALSRSGRGFGGGASAAGQAMGQVAQTQANQTNAAASLRAQEDAAWRSRQAQNLGNAQGLELQNQAQNDAMVNAMTGYGQQAWQQGQALGADTYFRGQDQVQQGYGQQLSGYQTDISAQGLGDQIRGRELGAGATWEDNNLRKWAAENDMTLAGQARDDKNTASWVSAGATVAASALSDVRAKKDIREDSDAALDFARSLAYDPSSGIYREQTRGGAPAQREGYRGATAIPERPTVETTGQDVTPMQAQAAEAGQLGMGGVPQRAQFDRDALDAVAETGGAFYKYKDPTAEGAAGGEKYGPMAQDFAKTPAGASVLTKMPGGQLGIDSGRAELLNTSAIAAQQKQIDDLMKQIESFKGQPGATYPGQR